MFQKQEKNKETTRFTKATKDVTYMSVINMVNDLNSILSGEYYSFKKDLKNMDGAQTCGFSYHGAQAGIGIRRILDTLGIKYVTMMHKGSGINEESDIVIDLKDKNKMLDIYDKIGGMNRNVRVEVNTTNHQILKELSQNIK